MSVSSNLPLRAVLLVDAATCFGMGLVLVALSGPLAGLTLLPQPLLFRAGAVLFPIAAFMALVALIRPVPPAGVWLVGAWLVVAGNAGWIAASLAILALGWVSPNPVGTALVIVQALAVGVLAWLEAVALLRRGSPLEVAGSGRSRSPAKAIPNPVERL